MSLPDLLAVLAHLGFLAVGTVLVITDIRHHRLPNVVVLPALAALAVLLATSAWAAGDAAALLGALAGAFVLGAVYFGLRLIDPRGLGGGDVKLAAVIGLMLGWHGWQALAVGAAAAFVLAAVFAIALITLRRARRDTRIAFGPWMIAGAWIGIALALT